MRGNLVEIEKSLRDLGSIPARAGEPLRCKAFIERLGVYPRACGEPFSILPSSGKPSARVGYRDTSSTASGSLREHLARPPCAE